MNTSVLLERSSSRPLSARLSIALFLLLLIVSSLVRLPSMFMPVVNWDESTMILMGQEILDGRLPYVHLWDVKPPLAFGAYAASIGLFGHSIEGVRFAGTLCTAAVGLAAVWVGSVVLSPGLALLAGVVTVLALAAQKSGLATMTEHFALVPLSFAWLLLAGSRCDVKRILTAGALLGIATLVRTNLALVSLSAVVALALAPDGASLRERSLRVAALCAGGSLALIACLVPYVIASQVRLFYDSVATAAIVYSDEQLSYWQSALKLAGSRSTRLMPLDLALWTGSLIALFMAVQRARRQAASAAPVATYWTLVFLFSASWSVLASGAGNSHYLIQLVPFLVLACLMAVQRITRPRLRNLMASCLAGTALLALWPVAGEYGVLARRVATGESVRAGRAWQVADFLIRENPDGRPVYLMDDHIAYWLSGVKPPTRMAVHPSNLFKPWLVKVAEGQQATPASELEKVFDRHPVYVIKPADPWYLRWAPEVRPRLDELLSQRYELQMSIDGLDVHRLRHDPRNEQQAL